MLNKAPLNGARYFLNAGMSGAELAEHDWEGSALGPIERWPQSLITAVGYLLHSKQAQVLVWGDKLTTFYNDAYRPLMGTAFWNGMGRPYPEFRPDIWPAIKSYIDAAFRGEGRCRENVEFETARFGRDELIYLTFSYAPVFREDGLVGGVLCTIFETTEQVMAQRKLERENQRFRELFREAPSFLCILKGPNHEIEFANKAYVELVGDRDLIGRSARTAFPDVVDQGFIDLLDRVYATGRPFVGQNMKVEFTPANGQKKERVVNFIYQPILDRAGRVTGILADGYDVTEEFLSRRREDALRQELLQASRLSAMVTMASSLAHELNQPLSAAKNYLGCINLMLQGDEADVGEIKEAVGLASSQIVRAAEIIRRVRAMISKRAVRTRSVGISDCITGALQLIETAGICAGTRIDLGESPNVAVTADQVQVEQVVFNLVKNACEAMSSSAVRELRLLVLQSADQVEVQVVDTGPGISGELERGSFEAFGTSASGGLGIGLAICRTMIEGMNGQLFARNNPAGGATFGFILPRAL